MCSFIKIGLLVNVLLPNILVESLKNISFQERALKITWHTYGKYLASALLNHIKLYIMVMRMICSFRIWLLNETKIIILHLISKNMPRNAFYTLWRWGLASQPKLAVSQREGCVHWPPGQGLPADKHLMAYCHQVTYGPNPFSGQSMWDSANFTILIYN